ncbi:putative oxidoreductase [Candidatus Izimaplasma bacterium HR1]|jgi:short-subunit dehydrogenase|uniref:SDR family NAD(P)-dependent oxidoreductase n=1 Tax=Candidatus Izimoplasma sp. HR1 TaxID=1541959 RepID=UPI0004F8B035|nr:putative oxidoreductase [Candidatus Izimaplasma bacterium HR1]
MSKVILISGASSGIGKEIANTMHNEGYTVIGLSRKKPTDINYKYYECDLTNQEQIKSVTNQIKQGYPKIDVLINCAGVGTGGAIEEVSYEDLKWVYEVNLFGTIELIKGILPSLKNHQGKIINIGSVAGAITIPYQTSYSMSKSSVGILTEGLRIELKQFNIDVCTVLPGDTKTSFTTNRKTILIEDSPYYDNVKRSIEKMEKDEQNGVDPSKVVKVVTKVMNKKKMPIQVTVGLDYKFLVFLSKILPKRVVEFIITKMYG